MEQKMNQLFSLEIGKCCYPWLLQFILNGDEVT
jgi:hypothetical protein